MFSPTMIPMMAAALGQTGAVPPPIPPMAAPAAMPAAIPMPGAPQMSQPPMQAPMPVPKPQVPPAAAQNPANAPQPDPAQSGMSGLAETLMSLQNEGAEKQPLPYAMPPDAPRSVNPNFATNLMQMLMAGSGGGGAAIPSLGSLMTR